MLISQGKFLQYQNIFYNKVVNTPYKIKLEIFTVEKPTNTAEFNIDTFVGDSKRASQIYEFNALYEKDISTWAREKYGLPDTVNGIVYLSPKQLVPVLGYFRLPMHRVKVHFEGSIQVINKIIYMESLYDSCVGIQIFVQDDLKGG